MHAPACCAAPLQLIPSIRACMTTQHNWCCAGTIGHCHARVLAFIIGSCTVLSCCAVFCCRRKADPTIEAIEQRVAEWSRVPAVHAEDFQVSSLHPMAPHWPCKGLREYPGSQHPWGHAVVLVFVMRVDDPQQQWQQQRRQQRRCDSSWPVQGKPASLVLLPE